jgi:TPR repeat protein
MRALKSGFSSWSRVLMILCVWALGPCIAECAPQLRSSASPPQIPRDSSALNRLGIRYAKGQGVKRNPGLAMRFFLQSAIQGYTPAMANLGTLYEIGALSHSDFRRAYAWVRAAFEAVDDFGTT